VKLPPLSRRSKFYQNLKKSGLSNGQIQYVKTLYDKGEGKKAQGYLRKQGVTHHRRERTRIYRRATEDLWTRAADAKQRKLGRIGDLSRATEHDLRQIIDLTPDELKRLASQKRPHNPFWYHGYVSYTQRILSQVA
jgi:hypothetical protein